MCIYYTNCYIHWIVFSLGSAIRVDLQQFPSLLTSLIGNPLCFLLYEDESEPPIDWNPVYIIS